MLKENDGGHGASVRPGNTPTGAHTESESSENRIRTLKDILAECPDDFDRQKVIKALAHTLWIALQRLLNEQAVVREQLGPSIPTLTFFPRLVQLSNALLRVLAEWRKSEEFEWQKQTSNREAGSGSSADEFSHATSTQPQSDERMPISWPSERKQK